MTAPAQQLMHLVMQHNLHPEAGRHASWWPATWPPRHRQVARLGEGGREVLAELLRHDDAAATTPRYNFEAPLARLALIDGASLRRLAAYLGLCAHQALLRQRGLGPVLRRQARRLDDDAPEFVLRRMPQLPELRISATRLQQHPSGAGRLMFDRGYRLLLATLAASSHDSGGGAGDDIVARVQRKLPRRVAALDVPVLDAQRAAQLREVLLQCLIPERLPQWDWLF